MGEQEDQMCVYLFYGNIGDIFQRCDHAVGIHAFVMNVD